jgi:hypothetical protein
MLSERSVRELGAQGASMTQYEASAYALHAIASVLEGDTPASRRGLDGSI